MEFYLVTCCQKSQNITCVISFVKCQGKTIEASLFIQTQILDYFNIVKSENIYLLACVQNLKGGGEEAEKAYTHVS